MGDTKKIPGCSMLSLYNRMFRRRRRRSSASSHQRSNHEPAVRLPCPNQRAKADITAMVVSPCHPVARAPLNYKPSAAANQRLAARKVPNSPKKCNGFSGELDSMIYDHQRTNGSSKLVRATSGNIMVFGNLGNIRSNHPSSPNAHLLNYIPKQIAGNGDENNCYVNSQCKIVMGNIVKSNPVSKRLDPEELRKMGNDAYKKGRFDEAITLYDQAIAINPEMASCRSNKAAALTGLGKLIEAVDECKEALRIEPSNARAHHRLAKLYLRLGEAEKAVIHYKLARNEASAVDISQALALQTSLDKCEEARKLGDWDTLLRETKSTVSAGADSAPQVFASQAEALLKLDRHDEAEMVLNQAPKFDVKASTNLFGATRNAYVLMIRAEVNMAIGRFEDAVRQAEKATQLDPSNRETSNMLRRSRAVASARSNGNDLFKASKFKEACTAYQEGPNHVQRNAIFLCNRAACLSKLGQWERAVEDCSTALRLRPSYAKARLRRADCNAKMERWEASLRDYKVLINEIPGDEEVRRAHAEAQDKLRKQHGWHEKIASQS